MFILLVQNEIQVKVNLDSVNCTEEEIFSQVLRVSRSGHVRGMGCGVRPTRSKSSRASTSQVDIHEECKKHREEIEASQQRMREEMVASQERMAASQVEMAASHERMAASQA
jgi:hypothetical protein